MHARVVEAGRERIQVFQGVVIRRQGGGLRETFTARKISFGVGVERTFPVHSPSVAKIEIVSRGRVRRAKLYYLRELRGKRARIRERRMTPAEAAAAAATAKAGAAPAPEEGPEDQEPPEEVEAPPPAASESEEGPEAQPGTEAEAEEAEEPAAEAEGQV